MKVLITGHKGFCGRHFVKALKKHDITGVDIKEGNDCRDFFKANKRKFDLVIHLAAIVGGRETIEGQPLSVATDLSIDAEMFNWALSTGQGRVVYFSSSAAYPTRLQEKAYKLEEDDIKLENIKNPDLTYGWAKLSGELLASFARKGGVKVYVFRPFSGYGKDQDLTYPFPSFIQRIKNKDNPFVIWGDGKQVRDFVHIDDIVSAVLKAVELDIQGPVNLGWGRPTSFNELAKIMFKVAGYKENPKIKHMLDKPVGVSYRCSVNKRMLGFYTPKISLEEGIKRSLASK